MSATYRGRRLTGYYRVPRDLVLSELWRRLTLAQGSVATVLISLADHATGEVVVSTRSDTPSPRMPSPQAFRCPKCRSG